MRYKLTMMLALAAMVVSCSKGGGSSKPTQPPYSYELSDSPIGFDGYEESDTDSRAYIREGKFNHGDSFGVLASLVPAENASDPTNYPPINFMQDILLELDNPTGDSSKNNNWVHEVSDTRYWPYDTNIKINFYAYYPHSEVGSDICEVPTYEPSETNKYPTLRYSPSKNAAFQYDFMTAVTLNMDKSQTTGGCVPLKFEHQLAKVKFSANFKGSADEKDRVAVTKVVYKGAKSFESGTFTKDGFEWNITDNATTPEYTLNSGLLSYETDDDGNSPADLPLYDANAQTQDYKNISADGDTGVLLLHPQTIGGGKASFEVTFKVFHYDIEIITAKQEFTVGASHTLKKAEAVNYQFTIDIQNVSSILAADVVYEGWIDGDNVFEGTIK